MGWAPDYVTGPQLKTYLNIQHEDDDLWLANWATAVSRNVDDFCGRQFGQVSVVEARTYEPKWDSNECKTYVEIDDLQTTAGLIVADSDGTVITDYTLRPRNAILKGKIYTQLVLPGRYIYDFSITGKWGWNSVPASIPTALYIKASRLNARRSSPFGIAGSPTDGSELRLLAQLDPDFKTTLTPFKREWYAA